ncbi:MAG: SET domain-containing protein-lysine N-methyltransferase [Beijerinckiaceae bacterium]
MKVCVLQPSYAKSTMLKDYAQHDPPRDLAPLVSEWTFEHVFLDKDSVYKTLKDLKKSGFDIFVNLCEGHLEWDVPSVDVIHALESLDLPFTGPPSALYEPRKDMLKLIARYAQVRAPRFVLARSMDDVERAVARLRPPLFIKPNEGGDSFGVDDESLCRDADALRRKAAVMLAQFEALLIEEFLDGREFSVLVLRDPGDAKTPAAFQPVEFKFPDGLRFKTYALKNTQFNPKSNVRVAEPELEQRLIDAARRIFVNHGGAGYCRMDFRLDAEGEINVIDANFTCSVFYPEGYYGTADYILRQDGIGPAGFLKAIVAEGLERYRAQHPLYTVRNDGVSGLGIEAVRNISKGEIVFQGEERAQSIVTKRWVDTNWDAVEKKAFAEYAYPLDDEVFILWSSNPRDWAPQNHSCDANTGYDGLNVVALRDIPAGAELTLDYATFYNEAGASFACTCGASNCRGYIAGIKGNTVQQREKRLRGVRCE